MKENNIEKKWYDKISHPLIGYFFTIIAAIFAYTESIKSSTYETKKDIAVLQAQYTDIKDDLRDIKNQLNERRNK